MPSAVAPARPGERVTASLADPPCRGVNKLSARIGLSPSVHKVEPGRTGIEGRVARVGPLGSL